MQPMIPAVPAVPMVSMIPEVRVYTGQNQIRRNVGLFTENYQGQDVRTINIILAPGESFQITDPVKALVMSSSDFIDIAFVTAVEGNVGGDLHVKLLVWDHAVETITFTYQGTEAQAEVALTYVV